jgi:hypothetical protein
VGLAAGSFPITSENDEAPENAVVDAIVRGYWELARYNDWQKLRIA